MYKYGEMAIDEMHGKDHITEMSCNRLVKLSVNNN